MSGGSGRRPFKPLAQWGDFTAPHRNIPVMTRRLLGVVVVLVALLMVPVSHAHAQLVARAVDPDV